MFITYRKFDILTYFIIGILIALTGKRYIYGGIIITYSASLLLQHTFTENILLYKYKNISFIVPVIIFVWLLVTTLYVLSKSTSVSDKQKLLSIVFLILSLSHSIARNISNNDIFKTEITKYISTLLLVVVLFTVAFIPDNQQILLNEYNSTKDKIKRF
jgi:predicted neutral ceramidase superfamily lipid hydrolase